MDVVSEAADRSSWTDLAIFLTASAALISAVIAAVAVYREEHRMRLNIGIDNMWRLIEAWDSATMKETRSAAAEHLLSNFARRDDLPSEALDVLDLFELLAYLVVRSKTLSIEDAWINFSGPAIQWWHVCRPGIERFQRSDPTLYEDFTSLVEKLMELEAERRGMNREQLMPSDQDLLTFLRGAVVVE